MPPPTDAAADERRARRLHYSHDEIFTVGEHSLDERGFVGVTLGNCPIVLACPHGGVLAPDAAEVPDRARGCHVADGLTVELCCDLLHALHELSQRRLVPHRVVCFVRRAKIDCNRAMADATEGHALMDEVWARYHGALEAAARWSVERFGFAHVFDVHGQSHRAAAELGYLVPGPHLRLSDSELEAHVGECSLAPLMRLRGLAPRDVVALLRGARSLGALLNEYGWRAVPSPLDPSPLDAATRDAAALDADALRAAEQQLYAGADGSAPDARGCSATCDTYFSGGYTTRRYSVGVPEGPQLAGVSATQIENAASVRPHSETRLQYAVCLAHSILRFMRDAYGAELAERCVPPPSADGDE